MKITIDDWHFRPGQDETLLVDLFLGNGQHALLGVNPMRNRNAVNGDIPELIVFGELPGEKLTEGSYIARWITRPPERTCPWSNLQLPPALFQQIKDRTAASLAQA